MTESLVLISSVVESQLNRDAAFQELREMVLNSVASEHSKRNYAKALDEVFTLCANRSQGLSRALLMEYSAAMLEKKLSPSTVNVRLSAVRKLVGEAQRNGIIGAEEAANLAGVPNLLSLRLRSPLETPNIHAKTTGDYFLGGMRELCV